METCISCNEKIILDPVTGEQACSKCGQVTGEMAIQESSYSGEPDSEVPKSKMFYKRFLPSVIDRNNTDAFGKKIENRYSLNRMRIIEKQTHPNSEKIYNRAVLELERFTHSLQLKSMIVERAFYIYEKAQKKDLIAGRTVAGVILACIYVACLESQIPFPQKELDELGIKYSMKQITANKKLLISELDLNTRYYPTPEQYIPKICSALKINGKIERYALQILEKVKTMGILEGRKPANTAGAIIYLTVVHHKLLQTQFDIAKQAGVTTISIRSVFKILQGLFPVKQ